MKTIIQPDEDINVGMIDGPSTLSVYESSLSNDDEAIVSLMLLDPSGNIDGGIRLNEDQVESLIDALLDIIEGPVV